MLATALASHQGALRASLLATYPGLRLEDLRSSYTVWDAAQLVIWLPPGCPLWQSFGGPTALSLVEEQMRWVSYRLAVLAWQNTEDGSKGRNPPPSPKPIPYASEREAEANAATAKRASWQRRQQLRARAAEGNPDG